MNRTLSSLLVFASFGLALRSAAVIPVSVISQTNEISGEYVDSLAGQSNSYHFTSASPVEGGLDYTSYYDGAPASNHWGSSADLFGVSVLGNASPSENGHDPFGSIFASSSSTFFLSADGDSTLRFNFLTDNIYVDPVDSGAITILMKRNGSLWDQESFSLTNDGLVRDSDPGTVLPSYWDMSLNNTAGDVWELTMQINEGAWDNDYVRVDLTAGLQAVPEPSPVSITAAGVLALWIMRSRTGRRTAGVRIPRC